MAKILLNRKFVKYLFAILILLFGLRPIGVMAGFVAEITPQMMGEVSGYTIIDSNRSSIIDYIDIYAGLGEIPTALSVFLAKIELSNILGEGLASTQDDDVPPALIAPPLFYPSPFRLESGSTLSVKTSGQGRIHFRVYDAMGYEVYRSEDKDIILVNGDEKITKFRFDATELGHRQFPAGVYFYLVFEDDAVLRGESGELVGKGKFGVLP
jgi:hypothetical protein